MLKVNKLLDFKLAFKLMGEA